MANRTLNGQGIFFLSWSPIKLLGILFLFWFHTRTEVQSLFQNFPGDSKDVVYVHIEISKITTTTTILILIIITFINLVQWLLEPEPTMANQCLH